MQENLELFGAEQNEKVSDQPAVTDITTLNVVEYFRNAWPGREQDALNNYGVDGVPLAKWLRDTCDTNELEKSNSNMLEKFNFYNIVYTEKNAKEKTFDSSYCVFAYVKSKEPLGDVGNTWSLSAVRAFIENNIPAAPGTRIYPEGGVMGGIMPGQTEYYVVVYFKEKATIQ